MLLGAVAVLVVSVAFEDTAASVLFRSWLAFLVSAKPLQSVT